MELFDVYPLLNIEPNKGYGTYIYDKNGDQYLDLYGGHAVISIGHSHPIYVQRLTDQIKTLGFYSNSVQNPLQKKLAQFLGELSGCSDYKLFLINSGAEANENALKMASFYNGRTKVLAIKNAFHGRTSAAVNVTDNEKIKAPINKTFEVDFLSWSAVSEIITAIKSGQYTAFIMETIQGIAGIYEPVWDKLADIQDACQETNTVFIADEIQCGYGRTGKFFAFQHAPTPLIPDIITVAKGMGNGFPIGAVLLHPKFKASHGLLGTTFGGSHLGCAAALAVLEVMQKEKVIANAEKMGDFLLQALRNMSGVVEVRGKGLLIGIQFEQAAKPIRDLLYQKYRVMTGSSNEPNTMRLLPALNIQKNHVNDFLQKLQMALQELRISG